MKNNKNKIILTPENEKKIIQLKTALENIGISCEIEWKAEWYCTDNKVHCGIDLYTDEPYGEDALEFVFSPDGRYIRSCLEAPIKNF